MPHTEKGKSTDPWDFATLEACGAIRSSASDMLRYAAANLGECDASLRDVLTTSHTKLASAENENVAIAYGWHRFEHKDKPPVVWHNGGTGGYRCMLVLQPEKKIAVVALSVGVVGKDLDRATLEHLQQLLRDEEAKPPNR
jgi:CubicO group peptidase (beta-lactamase class C family)